MALAYWYMTTTTPAGFQSLRSFGCRSSGEWPARDLCSGVVADRGSLSTRPFGLRRHSPAGELPNSTAEETALQETVVFEATVYQHFLRQLTA
jgi:hypothetical protein